LLRKIKNVQKNGNNTLRLRIIAVRHFILWKN
jgi:hypothetical protein